MYEKILDVVLWSVILEGRRLLINVGITGRKIAKAHYSLVYTFEKASAGVSIFQMHFPHRRVLKCVSHGRLALFPSTFAHGICQYGLVHNH